MIGSQSGRSVWAAPLVALATLSATPSVAAGQIVGRVLDDASAGVPGAIVRVVTEAGPGPEVLTDSAGGFSIGTAALGEIRLEVVALGFVGTSRVVDYDGRLMLTDLRVARDPIQLDELSVEVELRSPFLVRTGFYERSRNNPGEFLDLEADPPSPTVRTAQLFHRVTGVRVLGGSEPVFSRAQMWSVRRACLPVIIVDDILVREGGAGSRSFEDVAPAPATIAAVEFYPSGGLAPPRWRSSSSMCGVIAIWTKR